MGVVAQEQQKNIGYAALFYLTLKTTTMRKLITLLLCTFLLSTVLQAQVKIKTHKSSTIYYYIVLTYQNYGNTRKSFSDVQKCSKINEDKKALLLDEFEKACDPVGEKHFINRELFTFTSYAEASKSRHLDIDIIYSENELDEYQKNGERYNRTLSK